MSQRTFSIFFPVYNEEANLPDLLAEVQAVVPVLGFDEYEILFIDDGSTDGSGAALQEAARSNPRIRVVQHSRNMGYGTALRTGFLEARNDIVFYTDSDIPVDLAALTDALPLLADADLVIGFRTDRRDSLRRVVRSRIYNWLVRLLFGVHVHDVNFSFKLVKRRVLDQVDLSARSAFIDGQLLAEALSHGFTIIETPVEYRPRKRGSSSFDSISPALHALSEMLHHRFAPAEGSAAPRGAGAPLPVVNGPPGPS